MAVSAATCRVSLGLAVVFAAWCLTAITSGGSLHEGAAECAGDQCAAPKRQDDTQSLLQKTMQQRKMESDADGGRVLLAKRSQSGRRRRRLWKKVEHDAKEGADDVTKAADSATKDITKGADSVAKWTVDGYDEIAKSVTQAADETASWTTSAIQYTEEAVVKETKAVEKIASETLAAIEAAIPMQDLVQLGDDVANAGTQFADSLSDITSDVKDAVENLGPLVISMAEAAEQATVQAFTDLIDLGECFDWSQIMCDATIGGLCDCEAGSGLKVHDLTTNPSIAIQCVPNLLGISFKWSTSGNDTWPGSQDIAEPEVPANCTKEVTDDDSGNLTESMSPIPGLTVKADAAIFGSVQFMPSLNLSMTPGSGQVSISAFGDLLANLNVRINASAAFEKSWTYSFPEEPEEDTMCSEVGCLTFMFQANATLEVATDVMGVIEGNIVAQYGVSAGVGVDIASGQTSYYANTTGLVHNENITITATFDGSVTLTLKPVLTIIAFPPGMPVSITPWAAVKLNTHAAASFTESSDDGSQWDACAAADLLLEAGIEVSAPPPLSVTDSTLKNIINSAIDSVPDQIEKAIEDALKNCPPPLSSAIDDAVNSVVKAVENSATSIDSLIPDFSITFSPISNLLNEQTCYTLLEAAIPSDGSCLGDKSLACPS